LNHRPSARRRGRRALAARDRRAAREPPMADVRQQVTLALATEFENYRHPK
jgi:hypothetical protein